MFSVCLRVELLRLHFLVPFFFPPIMFPSSLSFLFFKVRGSAPCDVVPVCFSNVLRRTCGCDGGWTSVTQPIPLLFFVQLGWTERTKANDLPSPSSESSPLPLWFSWNHL